MDKNQHKNIFFGIIALTNFLNEFLLTIEI